MRRTIGISAVVAIACAVGLSWLAAPDRGARIEPGRPVASVGAADAAPGGPVPGLPSEPPTSPVRGRAAPPGTRGIVAIPRVPARPEAPLGEASAADLGDGLEWDTVDWEVEPDPTEADGGATTVHDPVWFGR
ncbi:MAG: hypothetical protein ABMB14_08605 [Myxococcota bacterium]